MMNTNLRPGLGIDACSRSVRRTGASCLLIFLVIVVVIVRARTRRH